ncbi:MAG: PilZ domain-containing protein [Deltaproteobacteria bacterium]|nr:PilZ domain-containing protein [Deltaproteobacteria bacterium]
MPNRRLSFRYEIAAAAEIRLDAEEVPAQAKNLSRGGVGLTMGRRLPEGAPLGLSLFLVEDGVEDEISSPLELVGEVIWQSAHADGEHEAGIRFAALDTAQCERLERFLSRLGS